VIDIERIPANELETARRLHNRFTAQSRSESTVREWYDRSPELFLFARPAGEGEPIGVATGHPQDEATAELAGLGVMPSRRREGIGSRLLQQFEANAAAAGFDRVSLGAAGGYVDRFYADHGYEAHRLLVRLPADGSGPDPATAGFEVREEREDGQVRKYYLPADDVDQEYLEEVRSALDEGAIYVMRKKLDGRS
jgi:GNAT superfamily N-acetyltransferase